MVFQMMSTNHITQNKDSKPCDGTLIIEKDAASEPYLLPELMFPVANIAKSSQPGITCSKLTIETLKQGVKYVQS